MVFCSDFLNPKSYSQIVGSWASEHPRLVRDLVCYTFQFGRSHPRGNSGFDMRPNLAADDGFFDNKVTALNLLFRKGIFSLQVLASVVRLRGSEDLVTELLDVVLLEFAAINYKRFLEVMQIWTFDFFSDWCVCFLIVRG